MDKNLPPEKVAELTTYKAPDRGWAWIILFAGFALQAIGMGLAFSVSVLTVEWLEYYKESVKVTSWVGSINLGILFGTGPFASSLFNRFGAKKVVMAGALLSSLGLILSSMAPNVYFLCFSYGVLAGIGFSLIAVPTVGIVGQYFDRLQPLAFPLLFAGVGVGNLAFAPLLRYLVTCFGLRGALLLEAGIVLQALIFAALLRPIEYENLENLHKSKSQTKPKRMNMSNIFELSLVYEFKFWIIFITGILWNIGGAIMLVLLGGYAEEIGLNRYQGAYLISIIGIFNTIGKIFVAAMASCQCWNYFLIYVFSIIIYGVAILLYPVSKTFIAFCALSALYGTMYGIQIAVLGMVLTAEFEVNRLSGAFGYVMLSNGIGALLVPPIAGNLYMIHEEYELPFYFGGFLTVFSGLLMFAIPIFNRVVPQSKPETITHGCPILP